ncbi:hypothetical protein SSX86_024839 [Deinandra increscens subsp. villosa]|uniref:Uncharacterized protein n=1 Tax=Deinandra increscens subsp. villosa TaxID=3103831 RepID=A0AAP0CGR2_9ASTR
MDYHSLKRRELQALCKEHHIPANSANSVLADKLSALLNEKHKPIAQKRTSMKTLTESTVEGEPAALKRQAKKVRFSPNNDLVEYELRSGEKQKDMATQTKARRKSVAKKVNKPIVDNNTSVELLDDSAQIPVKLTRSRVQLSVKDVVVSSNEKNQARREAQVFEKATEDNVRKVTRSKAHTSKIGGGESVEETLASRARVTRSKAQTLMEGGTGLDVKLQVKKKSGEQVETDENIVDRSKEIMDVPVRATRSRRQTLKEDVGNAVTSLQVDKKRTRRQMKATDSPVYKKEPSKRKSSRARGVEAVDEDEGDKVVRDSRVTRARAPLAMEVPGMASRSKANEVGIQQLEEPSKHASKKNVNRKKSVFQPEKTEVIIHLEEPVNRPVRKNTRRNSVIPKATTMVKAPTVGKEQSKGQSGGLSMIKGLEDKENVSGSGKGAAEEGFREASTGSHKSRKRRGTPIIDDQNIEIEYGSLVDKSPQSSILSDRKSDGKSVAKMQVESSLEKSMSRTNNQSSVENSSKVKSWAVRSGALIRDSSSKKRAKCGTKQNDSEHHDLISSKEATPVAKTGNFKLDDDITQPEVTPSIDKSHRRFTRSAIRSGAVIRDGSSKRRAKLSGTKQNDLEHCDVISSKVVTPVAKTGKSKYDGVTQPEVTPSIDKSHRRFTRSAIRSGAVIRDGSSKRRAKPSGTKQNDLERYDVISSKVATPVAKTGKFKHDGVTQPEVTPSIDKSHRRFTHSAIRSERKEPGQSAIKEQPVAGTQFSSAKVAKFRHDPAVNTAPGRITRRGIKLAGNAAGSFSEKVEKKKQTGRSAHKKESLDDAQMASPEVLEVVPNLEVVAGVFSETEQPFDEAQIFSPEVAEVGLNPDVDTVGVPSEYGEPYVVVQMSSPEVAEVSANPDRGTVEDGCDTSSEVVGQLLGDLSASESVRLPNKVVENRDLVSGASVDMNSFVSELNASEEVMEDAGAHTENLTYVASATQCLTENLLSGKQQKPLELQSFDDGTSSGNFSRIRMMPIAMADVAETVRDAVSDVSHEQNRKMEIHAESRIFSEAVNLETSVLESGRPDPKEKETIFTESGSTSKGLQTDVKIEEPLVSVVKAAVMEESVDTHISSLEISTKGNNVDDLNCDSISYNVGSPAVCLASIQQSDIADDGEQYDEDESANAHKPLMSEPVAEGRSVADEVEAQETGSLAGGYDDVPNTDNTLDPVTVNNKLQGLDMEDADDTRKQPAKELEFEVVSSTHNNCPDIPILGKLDGENGSFDAAKESEAYSMPSHACDKIQDPLLSGNDCEDEGDTTNKELESNPKPLPDIDAYDACSMGKDDFSIRRQLEPILEPSSAIDITVIPFSGNDVYDESDNATISDQKSHLHMFGSSGIDKGYVPDDGNNAPKELETGSELSNTNNLEDNSNAQDGESVHDQLASSDNLAIHEEDVGGDDLDPPQIKSIPVAAEVLDRSCDQEPEQMLNAAVDDVLCDMVGQSDSAIDKDSPKAPAICGNDALEESVLDINKNVVSSILGDIYDIDADDDRGNEKGLNESDEGVQPKERLTDVQPKERLTEFDEGFQPKEIRDVSLVARESLPITYEKEEAPVDDTDSDFPSVKEDDKIKQVETQNAVTSIDWGDLDLKMDEFENAVSADVVGEGKKDDQDSDIQASARTSSSIEESSGLEAGLFNSVRNFEENSQNVADRKSNQEVDMLKESAKTADVTQEVVNQSDSSRKPFDKTPAVPQFSHEDVFSVANHDPYSSLKQLFATPSTTQINNVKDGQMDAVSFANQDSYSSLKSYVTTPANTQTSQVKDAQEDATNFTNKNHYSSLKSLFTTSASSRTSHVNDSRADVDNLTFPAGRSNEDVGATGNAAHEFNYQWEDDDSKHLDDEAHGRAVQVPENEMYELPSYDDHPLELFGEEEVGGSFERSGRSKYFECKGDQVDEIKQFEFLTEAAGTSHHDQSGLKDNPVRSGEFGEKEETQMKGSEADDGLAFDTGK